MYYELKFIKPFGVLIKAKQPAFGIEVVEQSLLQQLYAEQQLIVLRGFKPFHDDESFTDYCQQWGEISLWPFGKILDLVEEKNPKDHIFDNSYMPLHWDGMYRRQVPEYQIFRCLKAPQKNQGGRTTFSNTLLVLQDISPQLKQSWLKVVGHYQRKMEFYCSRTISPIITQHPYKDLEIIRYSEPPVASKGHFINKPEIKFSGIEEKNEHFFHHSLQEVLYASSNFYAHDWQQGDVVIADNFSLLHGREGFITQAPRHIQRVHVLSTPAFNNPGLVEYEEG